MLKFGKQIPNKKYIDRPSSYGVIINDERNICIIKTFSGYTLPGGGANENENPVDTLHREILEEIGFLINVISELGVAEQFLFAEGEGYFRKICSYFLCSFNRLVSNDSEIDHEALWCNKEEALHKINFESSHKWALERGFEII